MNAALDQAARLAVIRAAIVAETVSYGEIAELQAIGEATPDALAGDTLLQEWAGLPESDELPRIKLSGWGFGGQTV